jgi:branched-subunit amino acid transport protein
MPTESLWIIVLACAAATFIWRALGVVVVKRIDADGAFFQWVTCVSYAMVAGLIFRMIIMPESDLAVVSISIRIAAVVIAFAAYYIFKRRLVVGVVAGGVSLSSLAAWFS